MQNMAFTRRGMVARTQKRCIHPHNAAQFARLNAHGFGGQFALQQTTIHCLGGSPCAAATKRLWCCEAKPFWQFCHFQRRKEGSRSVAEEYFGQIHPCASSRVGIKWLIKFGKTRIIELRLFLEHFSLPPVIASFFNPAFWGHRLYHKCYPGSSSTAVLEEKCWKKKKKKEKEGGITKWSIHSVDPMKPRGAV